MNLNDSNIIVSPNKEKNKFNVYIPYSESDNFSWLAKNKFKNITYLGIKKIEYGDYHTIVFNDIDFLIDNENKSFKDMVLNSLRDGYRNGLTYSESLQKVVEYFKSQISHSKIETLHGDIGEALFIIKCLELGRKEIFDSMRKNDYKSIDFSINKKLFEVKMTSKSASEIHISNTQFSSQNDVNYVVIKANFIQNKTTILDLYSKIKNMSNANLPQLLATKETEYLMNEEIIKLESIDLDSVEYYFYNSNCLPRIEIKEVNSLKKMTFTLDATNSSMMNINFDKYLKEL